MSAKHWITIPNSAPGDASRRPTIRQGEALLQMQLGVGLYDGPTRSSQLESGVLWVTSHRLVWLHDAPAGPGLELSLARVKDMSLSGGFGSMLPGALKSSPKITLTLLSAATTSPVESTQQSAHIAPSSSTKSTWICSICDSMNADYFTACNECGVKRDPVTTATNKLPQTIIPLTSAAEKPCPICTYINHIDVLFCEACDSRFPEQPKSASQTSISPQPANTPAEELTVKISFRSGGVNEFFKVLKASAAAREWEVNFVTVNIRQFDLPDNVWEENGCESINESSRGFNASFECSGIIKKADQTNQVLDQTLSSSFQDLDALMAKASDMVKLAESINSRLAAATAGASHGVASSLENPELIAFRSFLVDLGIPSPVTKEMTGDAYSQELCKELTDFLNKVIKRYGGMIALTDLYCIFNRARGVALISPQDLQKSAALFESLGLPYRLRKFDSGLLVIHSSDYSDDAIATRILMHVQRVGGVGNNASEWGTGVTCLDIASQEGVSIVLAKELLLITEKYGLICRDDSVEGLRFYDNMIV
ncbi:EAP30/Vps36 family-domain-containing protein, partial [Obelidium mucronatum]